MFLAEIADIIGTLSEGLFLKAFGKSFLLSSVYDKSTNQLIISCI